MSFTSQNAVVRIRREGGEGKRRSCQEKKHVAASLQCRHEAKFSCSELLQN